MLSFPKYIDKCTPVWYNKYIKSKEVITMTIKEMQDKVIRTWGFEHPATIYFFECCEINGDDQFLNEIAYEFAMGWKDEDEEI